MNGAPGGQGLPSGPRGAGGEGGPGQPIVPQDPDLENRRKAADLALKRLQDQLKRGETPQALKDELGFTDQDLERFMQRLQERLADPGLDRSPESESQRRQFESLLKGIQYQSSGQLRDGGTQPRNASDSQGSDNRPVPPALRPGSQEYRRRLNELNQRR